MPEKELKRLDANEKQEVKYCIPLWLRNEQIKQSIARIKARIEPQDLRPDPIAVVCFGPSLNDTWEKIKDFRYIVSCSGAHKFLIDRGIVPNWHVEVDPRPHKVQLIGPPHKDVEYLISSTCHAAVFDHLEGYNVKLWHVFDNMEDGLRTLPAGEWALTGGCSVGLRAMLIARFFGFRDLHIFGMDGCEGPTGKHAAAHPNQPKGACITEYEGVTYRTTPAFLEAARQTWHELDEMKDVTATFYGEGLVQAMAKNYQRKPSPAGTEVVIGLNKPALISAEYADLNAKLHRENLSYGVGGGRHAPLVLSIASKLGTTSVLDYGCGKGYLAKELPFPIWEYDPAIPEKSEAPRPADLVICTDVLEHVEPERLLFVLNDLKRCIKRIGYFVIHTGPAKKKYSDGRNTHLIQKDRGWWKNKLRKFFLVAKIIEKGPELHFVVAPILKPQKAETCQALQLTGA